MIRLRLFLVIGLLSTTWAQEEEPETGPDDGSQDAAPTAPAPVSRQRGPAPAFAPAPDISAVWEAARRRVTSRGGKDLTEDFVLELLDSVAQTIKGDFEELARRAQLFTSDHPGYTRKFYSSSISRDEVLGTAITARESALEPHFQALYDPRGNLLRVTYVEPRRWLAQQERLSAGHQQPAAATSPLVRYFNEFDLRRLKGRDYLKKKKMEPGEAYFRLIFTEGGELQSVQQYDAGGRQIYALNFGEEGPGYGRLEFPADDSFSLLTLNPYLFLQDKSVVKPDWQVAVTRDDEGNIASLQVFSELDQLLFFYTYQVSYDPKKRTRSVRGTLLSPDETVEQIFTLDYDRQDRLTRRSFFDAQGQLKETLTYQYLPKLKELVVTTRDPYGIITLQQNFAYPRAGK